MKVTICVICAVVLILPIICEAKPYYDDWDDEYFEQSEPTEPPKDIAPVKPNRNSNRRNKVQEYSEDEPVYTEETPAPPKKKIRRPVNPQDAIDDTSATPATVQEEEKPKRKSKNRRTKVPVEETTTESDEHDPHFHSLLDHINDHLQNSAAADNQEEYYVPETKPPQRRPKKKTTLEEPTTTVTEEEIEEYETEAESDEIDPKDNIWFKPDRNENVANAKPNSFQPNKNTDVPPNTSTVRTLPPVYVSSWVDEDYDSYESDEQPQDDQPIKNVSPNDTPFDYDNCDFCKESNVNSTEPETVIEESTTETVEVTTVAEKSWWSFLFDWW